MVEETKSHAKQVKDLERGQAAEEVKGEGEETDQSSMTSGEKDNTTQWGFHIFSLLGHLQTVSPYYD